MDADPHLERILRDLSRPGAYPVPPERVEIRQTHGSAVFLAGSEVFKVKKPVDLGFLDFSTLDKRLHFCQEEIRLNRRLAPSTYLGVCRIVEGPDGRLRVRTGTEETLPGAHAVEYAVWMRRLPEDRVLGALLARNAVGTGDLRNVARVVADFHARAGIPPREPYGTPGYVRETLTSNLTYCEPTIGLCLSRPLYEFLLRVQTAALDRLAGVLEGRHQAGRVRDTHGDLHSEHVVLTDPVVIYDCIDFTDRFRFNDVAAEIAFLAMDLDSHGRRDLSSAFVEEYVSASGDGDLPRLLNLYRIYRAGVRGKVEGIRARDPAVPGPERESARRRSADYLLLAASYALLEEAPVAILLGGPSGSGKSVVARDLARRFGWDHWNSDVLRKEIAGVSGRDTSGRPSYVERLYSQEMSERTYAELLWRGKQSLAAGRSVVLDATFPRRSFRDPFRAIAPGRTILAFLNAPAEVLHERLTERLADADEPSDAGPELLAAQLSRFEFPDGGEGALLLDATRPADEHAASIFDAIAALG